MYKRLSVLELVKGYIQEHIVKQGLNTGDALPASAKIAKELEVSLGSVREAVRALEAIGIVEVRHGDGLYFRGLNLHVIVDIFSFNIMLRPSYMFELVGMRRLLESNLMPEVVQKIAGEDIARCRQILQKWEADLGAGLSVQKHDRLFHQTLYRCVENRLIIELSDIFWVSFSKEQNKAIQNVKLPEMSDDFKRNGLRVHERIVAAVEQRDGSLSKQLMYDHFDFIMERLRLGQSIESTEALD